MSDSTAIADVISLPSGEELSIPPGIAPEELTLGAPIEEPDFLASAAGLDEAAAATGMAVLAEGKLAPWAAFIADTFNGPDEVEYCTALIGVVQRASELTGIAPEAICGVLAKESALRHFDKAGNVICGDGGCSIGIGQVGRSDKTYNWERYFSYNDDWPDGRRAVRLNDLGDNVLACAALLWRGGWTDADAQAQLTAYAYYNSGKHSWADAPQVSREYALVVAAAVKELRQYERPEQGQGEESDSRAIEVPAEDDYLAEPAELDGPSQDEGIDPPFEEEDPNEGEFDGPGAVEG